jgi:transposase
MNKRKDTRHLKQEQQEVIRQKVVDAVLSGEKRSHVAKLFGVSPWSVGQWVRKAVKQGKQALLSKKRGAHKPRRLNARQECWVKNRIADKHPEQLKLPFVLWTREAIQQLIWDKYGLDLPLRTLTDYLKRWGFTPQKPLKVAYQRSPQKVKAWLEEEYPAIQAQAKAQKGVIYWGDEMGLRSDHQSGRSFSPKGKTPAIHTTGNRFGCNMISAVSNLGKLYFSVFEGSCVVTVFLDFLKRLVKQNKGRKVFFIVDGHPVHKAKAVQEWVAAHGEEMALFYLPGYSPDLNPDELLNQDLKATVFKEKRPKDKQELKALLSKRLSQIQKDPERVRSYFKAKTVSYAAA